MTWESGQHKIFTAASGPRALTVAVLSDEVSNGYSEPILAGFAEAARERNISVASFIDWLAPEDVNGPRRLVTDLPSRRSVDAVLLLSLGYRLSAQDLADYCERFQPLPMCSIADVAAPWCSRVSVDNDAGMREGIAHLVEMHGYRRVAFVRGPQMSEEADLRFRIYREVLAKNGIAYDPDLVVPGDYTIAGGQDAARMLLERIDAVPRAIACANDGMALGVLDVLTSRGISVPDQVALLGFDDIDIVRYADPPLTTARQPVRELGVAAFELLFEQLVHGAVPQRRVLPSQLVIRESCGCAGYHEGSTSPPAPVRPGEDRAGVRALSQSLPVAVDAMRGLNIPGAPRTPWAEQLCAAFLAELAAGETAFLKELRKILHHVVSVRGDVGGFHKAVTSLWQLSRKYLPGDSAEWRRADRMLHGARLVISGVSERMQNSRQLRFEDFSQKIIHTNNALGLAVDLPALQTALHTHLPTYGITACLVCLYENPHRQEPRWSRLIAGFSEVGELQLPPGGLRFASEEVLPAGCLPADRFREHVVGPLVRSGVSPGYVVFTKGPSDGFLYEALFIQIGGALQRLDLVDRLVAEAALREAAERERLEKELAIATRIQTGILPREIAVPGLEISAAMLTATEVGGDYYDVIPAGEGCWFAIGDVAGHGVPAGLVMLMLQSILSVLCRTNPTARPSELLPPLNTILIEHVRDRLEQDEYATLTLFRYDGAGHVTFAGAHEDILVYRRGSRRTEWVQTPGTWVAATRQIDTATVDTTLALELGDVMVLYTDGVTEACNPEGEYFGPERIAQSLGQIGDESCEVLRDRVIAGVRVFARGRELEDDVTVLVVRRTS